LAAAAIEECDLCTDAALMAKALTRLERLERVLNTEISAELRGHRQQAEPKPVRTMAI